MVLGDAVSTLERFVWRVERGESEFLPSCTSYSHFPLDYFVALV